MPRTTIERLSLVVVVVLAACSDSTSATAQFDTVTFSFVGDTSGSFSASAERNGEDPLAAFQAGKPVVVRSERAATGTSPAFLVLDVLRPFGNGRYDIFTIWAPPQIGTHQLGFACGSFFLDFAPGVQLGNFEAYNNDRDRFYFVDECGSVTIEELSSERVSGRFSGRAATNTGREIQISNGRFSLGASASGSVANALCQLLGNC